MQLRQRVVEVEEEGAKARGQAQEARSKTHRAEVRADRKAIQKG